MWSRDPMLATAGDPRPDRSLGSAAGNAGSGPAPERADGPRSPRFPAPDAVVKVDLLDHRSPQSEQPLPYPEWAHVVTVPLVSVPAVRSQNRRSTTACAPPARRSGAPQRPDLTATKRGRRRLSSSANPATSSENVSRPTTRRPALLDQTTTAALPATAFTSPTERAGEPRFRRPGRAPGPADVSPLAGVRRAGGAVERAR